MSDTCGTLITPDHPDHPLELVHVDQTVPLDVE